jgi:hypothetical protein
MPIIIEELICSNRPHKRFAIKIKEGEKTKTFHFGLDDGQTYIDHEDKQKRSAYLARHLGNKTENRLITNFIPSASLFSAKLLWGDSTDLFKNLINLQKEFNEKHIKATSEIYIQ